MLHVFPSTFRPHQFRPKTSVPTSGAVPALTPAAYLRLRREAAGLTVRQAAEQIARPEDRDTTAALIALLETPGSVARHWETLDYLACAFPFDPAVYRQLVNHPADSHPRICRGCGCSHWDPCVGGDGQDDCGWATDTACTRCAGDAEAAQQ